MRMLAFCVMRNHWHLVAVAGRAAISISAYMHRVTMHTFGDYHHALRTPRPPGISIRRGSRNPSCKNERGVLRGDALRRRRIR